MKKRIDSRLPFLTKCILDIEGAKYNCLVNNISNIGALIEMDSSPQNHIHVNGEGLLTVLLLSPVQFACKVVRIDSNQVGLQFFDN